MEWKRNTRERIRRGEKVQERGKKPETEIEEMKIGGSDYERVITREKNWGTGKLRANERGKGEAEREKRETEKK